MGNGFTLIIKRETAREREEVGNGFTLIIETERGEKRDGKRERS